MGARLVGVGTTAKLHLPKLEFEKNGIYKNPEMFKGQR
jgi:hypothetical protein